MSEITELLERFRKGPELLAVVTTGAAGAELDWAPEGKWPIRYVLAHLCDSEIVSTDRLRRMIAENNPTLQAWDQNLWAANLDYARRRTTDTLETFRRLRAGNYELLKDLPAEAYARTANHTERGTITLREMVDSIASHTESHARQIRDLRDRFKQEGSRRRASGA